MSKPLSQFVVGAVAVAAALIPGSAAASGFHGATFSVLPNLKPAFSQEIHDYTTTCPERRIVVAARSPRGVMTKIHSLGAAAGSQSVRLALAPGQRIIVRIRAGRAVAEYSVRCLPPDFPEFTTAGRLPASVPFFSFSQWTFLSGHAWPYAVIADRNGVPIWWRRTPGQLPLNIRPAGKGRLAYWLAASEAAGFGSDGSLYEIRDFAGRLRATVGMAGYPTDAHEAWRTPRGTWYVAAYVKRDHVDLRDFGGPADGSVSDVLIREVTESGEVVWSWTSKGRIALSETGRWWKLLREGGPPTIYDLVHFNSLEEDGKGGLIVSLRTVDAVYRIRRSDGAIDWKLGGTRTARSLDASVGDPGTPDHLLGQHDARVLADGTITVYDNRSFSGQSPRVTRWRINPVRRTATLVEQVSDPVVTDSFCCGSARRFRDGSWLVAWGGTPEIRAYGRDHRLRFRIHFDHQGYTYRAVPFLPGDVSRAELVSGMDAMNRR